MADATYQTKIYETSGGDAMVVVAGGTITVGSVVISTNASGHLIFTGLPIADPHVAGALWSNAGVVTVSAG